MGKEEDFEGILQTYNEKIYKVEVKISQAHVNQRKITALVTTYSLLLYVIWLISFFFVVWPQIDFHEGAIRAGYQIAPVFLCPALIYLLRTITNTFYRRFISSMEVELDSLRKAQKLKVEEMKQKMRYYQAKNLIERYEGLSGDGAAAKPVNSRESPPSSPKMLPPQVRSQSPANQIPALPRGSQNSVQNSPTPNFNGNMPSNIDASPLPMNRNLGPPPPPNMVQFQPNHLASHPPVYERTWVDRVLDVLVGEESNSTNKYALICQKCFNHNGLVLPEEMFTLKYLCPKCGHLNPPRKRDSDPLTSPPLSPVSSGLLPSIEGKKDTKEPDVAKEEIIASNDEVSPTLKAKVSVTNAERRKPAGKEEKD